MWKTFTEYCSGKWSDFKTTAYAAWKDFVAWAKVWAVDSITSLFKALWALIKVVGQAVGVLAIAILGGLGALIYDAGKWCLGKIIAWINKL